MSRKNPAAETGRYLIKIRVGVQSVNTVCLFLRSEYQGWDKFHCAFKGGAMKLEIRSISMEIRKKGSGWESKDPRFEIESVEMISREEYLEKLKGVEGWYLNS